MFVKIDKKDCTITVVLVNGYEVWHINGDDIHIGFTEDGLTLKIYLDDKLIGVPPYVTAVWHDDRYIIVI